MSGDEPQDPDPLRGMEMEPAKPVDYHAIRSFSFDDLLMHKTPDKLSIAAAAGASVLGGGGNPFIAPSQISPGAPPRAQRQKVTSHEVLRATRANHKLTAWPGKDPGKFWASKQMPIDANAMRFNAAREVTLQRHLYEDPEVFSYGRLPPQILPGVRADINKLHPVDKIDAKHPRSLCMTAGGQGEIVGAWDGTRKTITAPMLWRASTSNV